MRSLLDVSQAGLGDILGCSRAKVARWEAARNDAIPGADDRLLRFFYALTVSGNEVAHNILDLLTKIDVFEHEMTMFEETEAGWEPLAA